VKPFGREAVPLGAVTATATAPAACGGVDAVIVVSLTTVMPVAAVPPNVTAVAPVKPVPVIVTEVPPIVEPLFGATELTVGAPALIMTVTLAGADENGPAPVELSVALTVKLKVPAAVGAPLSVPLLCSVVPAGKASEASARQLNPKEAEALI
jgi:hypothetical protein